MQYWGHNSSVLKGSEIHTTERNYPDFLTAGEAGAGKRKAER